MPINTGVLQAAKSLSAAGTTFSASVDPLDSPVGILVDLTAIAGVGATLTLSVQWSNDNVRWADADPADSFTALTAVSLVTKSFTAKGKYVRLKEVLTGTTPTATYTATFSAD